MEANAHYFSSADAPPLEQVTAVLRREFDLPEFEFDGKASWRWARSSRKGIGFNVTRDERSDVIETWIPGTPSGTRYQILVITHDLSRLDRVRNVLRAECGMATHFVKTSNKK